MTINRDILPINVKIGDYNRYDISTKTITVNIKDIVPFTIDHELGHGVMDFIVKDSEYINKVKEPHFSFAVKYAWLTYVAPEGVERADEGWAQSFCDYFHRGGYLKYKSPELFRFWNTFMKKNPRVLNTRKYLYNKVMSKK